MDQPAPRQTLSPLPAVAERPLRLRIIHNPTAGGARWRRYGAVLERLDAAGARVEDLATGRRGDAEAYAAALARDDCDRLVVAGGDGTINEAINGLLANGAGGRTLPLAILPLGTANVLAQELRLSTRPAAVARYILEGTARPVSLGEANGRAFCLMAGVGFDAHVVARVDGRLKKRIGKLAYVVQTLRQLAVYDFPHYRSRSTARSSAPPRPSPATPTSTAAATCWPRTPGSRNRAWRSACSRSRGGYTPPATPWRCCSACCRA
jgi:diacylglycerol kinase family enzyme